MFGDPLGAIWSPNQAKGAQSRHFWSPGSILGAILRTLGTSLGVPSPTPGAPRWSPDAPETPTSSAKRQRGDSNPCGQSPMDFESISLTTRARCPCLLYCLACREAESQIALQNAESEDRTHDLRIMRPTRYQLRYCRSETKVSRKILVREKESCAATPERRNRTPACPHAP